MHGTVKPLTLPVSFRVIRGSAALLDPIEPAQIPQQIPLKVTPLVRVDALGYPIHIKPLLGKNASRSACLLIRCWIGLRTFIEDLSKNKHIFLPITSLF